MCLVKHKEWVESVERLRPDMETRIGSLRLDKNERVVPFEQEFMSEIIKDMTSEALCAYPEVEPFYHLLAKHLGVHVNQLFVTAGSDAAIRHCFDLFVSPGDKVIVLDPTFAMVDVYCGLFNARRYAVGYDAGLNLQMDRMLDGIDEDTALVVIANPNSPTGTLVDEDSLRTILGRARESHVPVLVDEAYYGFCLQSALPLLPEYENLIISRTFSKAFGLAGMRVGCLISSQFITDLLYRFRPMYEVNSLGIHFASKLIDEYDMVRRHLAQVSSGKKYLHEELERLGLDYLQSHTNFVHIDMGERLALVKDAFKQEGVLVRGGLPIAGYETFLRVTIGPVDSMARVVSILKKVFVDEKY